jgi:demethylmenaquinone methyltransferase/2-methoxy-6-polyprenyl-1,4-benzoquinol methylase
MKCGESLVLSEVMANPPIESKDPARIEAMFSRIAPRYDIANRILSMGFDMSWRRKAVKLAEPSPSAEILDMGCGTGDMMSVVLKRPGFRGRVVGVDLSQPMLDMAKDKLSRIRTDATYTFRHGDTLDGSEAGSTFDLIMTCFGIRNFADLKLAFSEVSRMLKPGGKFLVIEFFALDVEPWYVRLYLKYILPPLGGLISGGRFAYSYLSRSKEHFVNADEFIAMAPEFGLKKLTKKPLTFGIAEIVLFEKEG